MKIGLAKYAGINMLDVRCISENTNTVNKIGTMELEINMDLMRMLSVLKAQWLVVQRISDLHR